MKKVLSLLVALLMLFSCAALAENDSTIGYVVLIDPVVYANGTAVLDMTGLAVELDCGVSDSGTAVVIAAAYVGENYDNNILYVQAQADENAVTGGMDGISNLYTMSISDLSLDIGDIISQIQFPSFYEEQMKLVDSLTVSTDGTTATLELKDAHLDELAAANEAFATGLQSSGLSLSDLDGGVLNLSGTATIPGDGCANITLTGAITSENSAGSMPISYVYDLTDEGIVNCTLTITAEGIEDADMSDFQLSLTYYGEVTNSGTDSSISGSMDLYLAADANTSYEVTTYINTGIYGAETSAWLLDATDAIDVNTMTDTQLSTLQVGLVGVASTAIAALQENVPGLASLLTSLTSGLLSGSN